MDLQRALNVEQKHLQETKVEKAKHSQNFMEVIVENQYI